VVAGIPPIQLLAKERTAIYNGCNPEEARSELIANWQREREQCPKGRWTFSLISDIGRWFSRSFGEVTFHTTQVLTGHGCFTAYLHRFHILESDRCAQCGFAPDDTKHGFFQCDAWKNLQRQACAEIGVDEIRPDNLVETMLTSPHSWTQVTRLISKIMMTRESEERARQGQTDG